MAIQEQMMWSKNFVSGLNNLKQSTHDKNIIYMGQNKYVFSFRYPGTQDFLETLEKGGESSDNVADFFFANVYDVNTWKPATDHIFFHIDNFVLSMSQDNAYYQFYKNAPGVLKDDCCTEGRPEIGNPKVWRTNLPTYLLTYMGRC